MAAASALRFYFSFRSPYSWLASARVQLAAAEAQLAIQPHAAFVYALDHQPGPAFAKAAFAARFERFRRIEADSRRRPTRRCRSACSWA